MEDSVKAVLSSMSSIKKPQKLFLQILFSVLMAFQGKATFRNMSRYCSMNERRFSRWYQRSFNFAEFNRRLLEQELPDNTERIAAIDTSFMQKSGKKTEGLSWFYHSQSSKAEKGLEISLVCTIDIKANTAYALDVKQTFDHKVGTRVDTYANQISELSDSFKSQGIQYLAADAYYSKVKFIDKIRSVGLHMIGKLRCDADMQWLYEGDYSGLGRPKEYDGKIDLHSELSRLDYHGNLDNGADVYSKVVHVKRFKRKVRIVLLRWVTEGKIRSALLFSTDTSLKPMKIIQYYQARFQIEFLFRDGKQYTGLMDCQARSKEAIHTHVNASLTTLNLLKLEDRRQKQTTDETVISIASWRRKKFNQNLMEKLFEGLDLDRDCEKVVLIYDQLSDYGAIAA